MKKILLTLALVTTTLTAYAEVPSLPMLEQGKMWEYIYHHFEDRETPGPDGRLYDHTRWTVSYQLDGDTVIDGRKYMKMYRTDYRDFKKNYFGAFREDDEGRVYMYDYNGDQQDFLLLDFSLHFDNNYFPDVMRIAETVNISGKEFCRYRYQNTSPDGSTYDLGVIGIEGVGFAGKGLVHYLFEPEPDCICDYEELNSVDCHKFWLPATAFYAPKEIELTDDERQLVANSNDFAFRLFRLARGEKSSILSPLSITYALGMINNGATGQTQQEICQTLGFTDAAAINAFCRKMLDNAGTLDTKTKALIANTVFVNAALGFQLQDAFVQTINDYYDAEPQNRDFYDGQTMDIINQWASDHTEKMIEKVLDEDSFNPSLVSYLLNALYFKGAWSDPFDAAETKEEPFGGGPMVPMMHKDRTKFTYAENDLYQAINLPYGNGAYQMSVFLPRENKDIGDVLNALNGNNWQVSGSSYEVDLKLPRFETENSMQLKDVMSALGMPIAFTPQAEFPNFCNVNVWIGGMFQVAKIRLDEQGTEAAAVTVIPVETSMPKTVDFHATRPFLYIISEQSTGVIFFIGQYTGSTTVAVPDSIKMVEENKQKENEQIYNLSGQRLSKAPAHGLYIRNGKIMSR